jgi:hypothetical protein
MGDQRDRAGADARVRRGWLEGLAGCALAVALLGAGWLAERDPLPGLALLLLVAGLFLWYQIWFAV